MTLQRQLVRTLHLAPEFTWLLTASVHSLVDVFPRVQAGSWAPSVCTNVVFCCVDYTKDNHSQPEYNRHVDFRV